MKDPIEHFIQQARELFPGNSLSKELEKNLRALASNAFSKLDIVSREEFDAQVEVLKRSRQKIEQLEQQLAELSQQLDD